MNLPGEIQLRASIDGRLFYATLIGDGSIQVTETPQIWTVTPAGEGCTLSLNGRYLSTQTVYLQYKNNCLVATANPAQAARLIPVAAGDSFYLQLAGTGNVFTLDTRGFVTQFEPLAGGNGYPYFQYLVAPAAPGWTLAVQNELGAPVVAPAVSTRFSQGQQAVVTVGGVGCIVLKDLGNEVLVTSGAFKQTLPYSGSTALTLKLNADKSFSLLGTASAQMVTGPIAGTAAAVVPLPAATRVYVNAFTNAGYVQQVTLTLNGGTAQQWQGSGEGNTELANTAVTTPADSSGTVNASVLMEYSPGGGTFQPSQMSPVGSFSIYGYNQRVIVSEDADDDDYNDTALILSWWVAPPGR